MITRKAALAAAILAGHGCAQSADAGKSTPAAAKSDSTFSYTREQQAALERFEVMPKAEAAALRLDRVSTVALGTAPAESPAAVGAVKVVDSTITVIDPAARRLRVYDRRGGAIATVSFDSAGNNRHTAPSQIATHGDTLFVVDLDMRRGIVEYDARGRRLASIPISLPGSTDFADANGVRVIATMPNENVVADGGGAVLWKLTTSGKAEAFGCVPDPLLRTSMKERTAYAVYRFTGVSASNGRFFCRQALSPVVQILGSDGSAQGSLRRAPPFYTRGPGVSQRGLDEAGMEHFRSTWTEHGRFFPTPSGFVSLYMTFDERTKRDRQLVFACDSAGGRTRCGSGELAGRPLDLRGSDTLVVEEPATSAGAAPTLGLYLVRIP